MTQALCSFSLAGALTRRRKLIDLCSATARGYFRSDDPPHTSPSRHAGRRTRLERHPDRPGGGQSLHSGRPGERPGHRERGCVPSLVSGFSHQADDHLRGLSRHPGRRNFVFIAGAHLQEGFAVAAQQDGLQAGLGTHHRQRAQDHHGEIGQRCRGLAGRKRGWIGSGVRGPDERRIPSARHDRFALGQSAWTARRRPVHVAARPRHSGGGLAAGFPAILRLFLDRGPARRWEGDPEPQQSDRPLRRRRRHEDRLHLPVRLQPRGLRQPERAYAAGGRAGRRIGRGPRREVGGHAFARLCNGAGIGSCAGRVEADLARSEHAHQYVRRALLQGSPRRQGQEGPRSFRRRSRPGGRRLRFAPSPRNCRASAGSSRSSWAAPRVPCRRLSWRFRRRPMCPSRPGGRTCRRPASRPRSRAMPQPPCNRRLA